MFPATFSELMQQALTHDVFHQYEYAWITYLRAASRAHNQNAANEEVALEYAWLAFDRDRPWWPLSLSQEVSMDQNPTPAPELNEPTDAPTPTPQGDGDPTPNSEPADEPGRPE